MKQKNIDTILDTADDVIMQMSSGRFGLPQETIKEALYEAIMECIGKDETPESYLPKFLTEKELSLAHQAVQFHARNQLRSEIRKSIDTLFGKE